MNSEHACVAALAGFDHMTTARLGTLLNNRSAADAFEMVSGAAAPTKSLGALFDRRPGLRENWYKNAQQRHPARIAEGCDDLGVRVIVPSDDAYPRILLDDPRRPAVLFVRGSLDALHARRVGIVGTRNPTQQGLQIAVRFGHELAASGIVVLSGLAKGIDGAAHRGALAVDGSSPVAIVANGHDQPYPKRHTALWEAVAERGAVVSEWPPGTAPDPFRFPQRNRILAALSEVVLVVESRERGGSLITAREAAERGVEVFAVPGPLSARSSIGTNRLIQDGAHIATEPDDLLLALGLDQRRAGRARYDSRPRPSGTESEVLDFCRREPRSVDQVAAELECTVAEAAMLLARLERSGWLCESAGWFELIDEWASLL